MEHTSIEDFQEYHNRRPAGEIDDISLSSPTSQQHYADTTDIHHEDDAASLSGSAHHSSGPDEPVFDLPSRHSSPRTSHGSDDEISLADSCWEPTKHSTSPFTPLKTRSPFRNPSSVRAMQTDITPPRLTTPTSRNRLSKAYSPSCHSTPRSLRSHTSSKHTTPSPTKKQKTEYPLVLLHITLLPLPHYPSHLLESVLPPSTLANWTLLLEKTTPTILNRGVLIPHPREDYELLEERLLESLELKQPRILKCGHFHLSEEEETVILSHHYPGDTDPEVPIEEEEDHEVCPDCLNPVHLHPGTGSGAPSKRWSIRLFAANGLMRAGAWGAAWREMERVDVEILPWMDDKVKRELEFRMEDEERRGEELRAHERDRESAMAAMEKGGMDEDRLREVYGSETPIPGRELGEELSLPHIDVPTPPPQRHVSPLPPPTSTLHAPTDSHGNGIGRGEIPLSILLRNYLDAAARDNKNLAIIVLSLLVLYLSIATSTSTAGSTAAALPPIREQIVQTPIVHERFITTTIVKHHTVETPVARTNVVETEPVVMVMDEGEGMVRGTNDAVVEKCESPAVGEQESSVEKGAEELEEETASGGEEKIEIKGPEIEILEGAHEDKEDGEEEAVVEAYAHAVEDSLETMME